MIVALAPDLDPPTRRRALAAAEGNPLYLSQILAMLCEGRVQADGMPDSADDPGASQRPPGPAGARRAGR